MPPVCDHITSNFKDHWFFKVIKTITCIKLLLRGYYSRKKRNHERVDIRCKERDRITQIEGGNIHRKKEHYWHTFYYVTLLENDKKTHQLAWILTKTLTRFMESVVSISENNVLFKKYIKMQLCLICPSDYRP